MSKLKVGDKVRKSSGIDRGIGEVVHTNDHLCGVSWSKGFALRYYGVDQLELVEPAPTSHRHWIADAISDSEACKRVEVEYVIADAKERRYIDVEMGDPVSYWTYPLQDTITERLADGWTLKQVLSYGQLGFKFMAIFEREVSDEDMNPFSDRPDAVGGR
jgi:hypothetical protein